MTKLKWKYLLVAVAVGAWMIAAVVLFRKLPSQKSNCESKIGELSIPDLSNAVNAYGYVELELGQWTVMASHIPASCFDMGDPDAK